jgi:hypothetical protein
VAAALSACSDDPKPPPVEQLPHPSTGAPTVVPGQAPVVWVSGQSATVSTAKLTVVETGGSRAVVHRLSEGATRFFVLHTGRFEAMPEADALLVRQGTPMCVESLLDGKRLLALRVFVGAACGPRS